MFDFTGLSVLVREYFTAPFIDVIRRENVFLSLLEPRIITTNEKDIRWKVNYAGNTNVGSYAENDDLGVPGEQAYTTAQLEWILNRFQVRISGLAQEVSKGNNSIISDAITQEITSGTKDLKRNMNLQLLSDGVGNLNGVNPALQAGGTDFIGIQAAIDDGTDVANYAGINRAGNLWWRSFVLANGGVPRPITEALMTQCTNEIETRGGKITHIFCSPSLWAAYGNLLQAERRQVNPGMTLYGGFQTLEFQGMTVVKVPSYQEGRMDMIDLELLNWHMLLGLSLEPRDPGNRDASQMFAKTYSLLQYQNPWLAASIRDLAA